MQLADISPHWHTCVNLTFRHRHTRFEKSGATPTTSNKLTALRRFLEPPPGYHQAHRWALMQPPLAHYWSNCWASVGAPIRPFLSPSLGLHCSSHWPISGPFLVHFWSIPRVSLDSSPHHCWPTPCTMNRPRVLWSLPWTSPGVVLEPALPSPEPTPGCLWSPLCPLLNQSQGGFGALLVASFFTLESSSTKPNC